MEEELKGEIKETKVADIEKETLNFVASFLIGAVILSLFLLLGVYGYTLTSKNTLNKLNEKISEVDTQINALKDLDAQLAAFSSAVSNIQNALSQRKKWSAAFKKFNSITPKDVGYSNFSAEEGGKVRLSGFTPSLSSLAKLLVALQGETLLKNVVLNSVSIADKISFTIDTELNPSILKEVKTGEQK